MRNTVSRHLLMLHPKRRDTAHESLARMLFAGNSSSSSEAGSPLCLKGDVKPAAPGAHRYLLHITDYTYSTLDIHPNT